MPDDLKKLTLPEINYYVADCNFSDEELRFFNLRAQGKSLVEISFLMNISQRTASRYSKRVLDKMEKIPLP